MLGRIAPISTIAISLCAAAPVFAAECGPLTLITTLPMTPLGRPGNVVTVPVTVGDKQMAFLIDTGGAFSTISRRTVRELGLKTQPSAMGLVGINGTIVNEQVRLPSISLGRIRQQGAYLFVVGQNNPTDQRPERFSGTIAPDFLLNVDVDLDFGANKVNLISQQHCDGKVVYWTAPAVATVAFTVDTSGHITFPMKLDGKRINAALDTGSTDTLMDVAQAERNFGFDSKASADEKSGELRGGYTVDVYRHRFKTLEVGDVTVQSPTLTLLPNLMARNPETRRAGSLIHEDDGLSPITLGMSVLSKLHVYIAYKERKLYVSLADTPVAASEPPPSPQ